MAADLKIGLDVKDVTSGTKTITKSFESIKKSSTDLGKSIDIINKAIKEMGLKDAKSLVTLQKGLDKLAKTEKDVASSTVTITDKMRSMAKEQAFLTTQSKQLEAAQSKYNKSIVSNELKRGKTALNDIAKAHATQAREVSKSAIAQAKFNKSLDARKIKLAKAEISAYAEATRRATIEAKKLATAARNSKWGQFKTAISGATAGLVGFAAAATAAYAIKELGVAVFKAGQETLVAENAYKAITGSVAGANKEFQFLKKTAEDLGQNFFTLRTGYQGFLAAAQSSKIPMEEVRNIFRSITNATSVMGLSAQKTSLVFLALEQMMSKGKVSMEEIRRQMGDSLPGAFQIGARAMGMTVEAFDKAVSAGEIYSEDFLPKFRVAMEESFQGTIADSVKAVNKLQESWELLKVGMAEGGFMKKAVGSLKEITTLINDPATLRNMSAWASLGGTLSLWAAISFNKVGAGIANLGDKFAALGIAASGNFDILLLSQDELSLKLKEMDGTVLTGTEKWKLYTAEIDILQSHANKSAKELRDLGKAEDSVFKSVMIPRIEAELKAYEDQIVVLQKATKAYIELTAAKEGKSGAHYDSTTTDLNNADAKEIAKTLDAIEKATLKRIEKTTESKLALQKKDLKFLKMFGSDKVVIIAQYNKEILALEKKLEADKLAVVKKAIAAKAKLRKPIDDAITKKNKAQLKVEKDLQDEATKDWEDYLSNKEDLLEDLNDAYNQATLSEYDYSRLILEQKYKDMEGFYDKSSDVHRMYKALIADIDKKEADDAQKLLDKELAKQQKSYDKMLENIQDETASFFKDLFSGQLDSFEDLTDSMMSLFTNMLAEMAAKAIAEPILLPIVSSLVGSLTGGVVSSATGSATGGITDSIGKWVGGKIIEPFTDQIIDPIKNYFSGLSIFESSTPLYTTAMADSTLALNTATSGLTMPATATATTTSSLGSLAATAGSAAVVAGMAAVAMKIFENSSFLGGTNTPSSGFSLDAPMRTRDTLEDSTQSVNYGYRVYADDLGINSEVRAGYIEYFDGVFDLLDEVTTSSIQDILSDLPQNFEVSQRGNGLAAMSSALFDEMIGDLLLDIFPDAGTITRDVTRTVGREYAYRLENGVYYSEGDERNTINSVQTTNGMKRTLEDINQVFEDEISTLADTFDTNFFTTIAGTDGNIWDSFLGFVDVVENTDDFFGEFTRQTDEFGETAIDAYENMQILNSVLTELGISDTESITALDTAIETINDSFKALVLTLEDAHVSVENLDKIENKRLETIGSTILGLSESGVKSSLLSGSNPTDVLDAKFADILAEQVASEMWDAVFSSTTIDAAGIYAEDGLQGILDAAEQLKDVDLSPWDDSIEKINELTGNIEDLAEAAEAAGDVYSLSDRINLRDFQGTLAGKTETDFISDRLNATDYGDKWNDVSDPTVQKNWLDWTKDTKRSEIISYLEDVGIGMDDFISDMTYFSDSLEELAQAEEDLMTARLDASQTIKDMISDLEGGSLSPVQSMEYFQNKYEQAGIAVHTASTAEEFAASSANYASVTPEYLAFAQTFGGNYKDLYNQVISDSTQLSKDVSGESFPETIQNLATLAAEGIQSLRDWADDYKANKEETIVNLNIQIGDQEINDYIVEQVLTDEEVNGAVQQVAGTNGGI